MNTIIPSIVCVALGFTTLGYLRFRPWLLDNTSTECLALEAIKGTDGDEDFELERDEQVAERDEEGRIKAPSKVPVILPKLGSPNYYRFAAKVAHVVKAKMGLPKANEANRLVALELVSKELIARDVRKVDVHKFQAIAVDLVFMPTKYDVSAFTIRESRVFADRLDQMTVVPESWIVRFTRWATEYHKPIGLRYSRT